MHSKHIQMVTKYQIEPRDLQTNEAMHGGFRERGEWGKNI